MTDDIPVLAPGEEEPGHWGHTPGQNFRTWQGIAQWKTLHGPATVVWMFAKPHRVYGVRHRDGTRIPFVEKRLQHFSDEILMRWRDETGIVQHGTIEIMADDVVLTPAPPVKPVERTSAFECDLFSDDALRSHLRDNDDLARAFYRALCNTTWRKGEEMFDCSWRTAGGLVADLRGRNEYYLDFYLGGNEGDVSPAIVEILAQRGWCLDEENSLRDQS